MRVPMLAYAPAVIEPGTIVTQMVQNIDVARTLMDVAGIDQPADTPGMDGQFLFFSLS